MSDSRFSSFKFRIFTSLILVISVAQFSHEAPEFVVKSISSNFLDPFYLLFGGILIFYSLISRKGLLGKNVKIATSLGFKASIDYVEEILLNVECMKDFEYVTSRHGDSGEVCGNAERLKLPIRSLNSFVDEQTGVKCVYDGLYEDQDRDFHKLRPVNLFEKFNEASTLC